MHDLTSKLRRFSEYVGQTRGQAYFNHIVMGLAEICGCDYIMVGELDDAKDNCSTLAICDNGVMQPNVTYRLTETPCQIVSRDQICCFASNVQGIFAGDKRLSDFGAESYIGVPLHSANGDVLGLIVALNKTPIQNEDEIVVIFEMAAYRVAAELERRIQDRSLEMLSSIFRFSSEAMIVTNAEHQIVEVNDAFCDMFGFSRSEALGKNPSLFSSGEHNAEFFRAFWEQVTTRGNWRGEIKNRHADGSILEQWSSVNQVKDESGKTHHYTAIYTDLTELKKTQAENIYLASTDQLSGLSNKALLAKQLARGGKKWMLAIRLDGLRYFNEAYGFDACDGLIKETASQIMKLVKADCYVGIDAGKFVLLFNQSTDLVEIARELHQHFSFSQVTAGDVSVYISLSFGGCIGDADLLRLASSALRQSQAQGKFSCVVLEQECGERVASQRHVFVEANNLIHTALNNELLVPYFQGIRNNHTGQITHFEALARIIHNGKVISPYSFIEAAQVAGMLPLITQQIARQAFRLMSKTDYTFSVNITEHDLNGQYLSSFLNELCNTYSVAPGRVILEVLEGISSSSKNNHLKQLRDLKRIGFKLAIDDFGTEYSNFERILELEIDYLKIDARYIKQIDTDTKSYEIVKAFSYFCNNSGIKSIAEFVHSQAVQNKLLELGIDYSQGFLFSEPQPL